MSDARADILARLKRSSAPVNRPPSLIPAVDRPDLAGLFEEKAVAAGATVRHLADADQAAEGIAHYLRDHNLPARCVVSPDIPSEFKAALQNLDRAAPSDVGQMRMADGMTVISGCRAAVDRAR